jgi:phosphatidylinositol glycan class F
MTLTNDKEGLAINSYIAVVGVHTTLWAFTALYLPRTTLTNSTEWHSPQQLSSRDRPQHPFLVALTQNPTWTLACICLGAGLVQSWWAGQVKRWSLDLFIQGTKDEKRMQRAFHDSNKLIMFLKAWAATFLASFLIHVILVLFGAPISSLVLKTYLLALLISIASVYTPALVLGIPTLDNDSTSVVRRWTWIRLFAELSPRNFVERAIVFPAIGTVIGCWIGVIPIALDWDRPWQAWPLTPAFGAIGGLILSSISALTVTTMAHVAQEQSRSQISAELKSK